MNPRTGRPVRKSAARNDLKRLGYVNTNDVIDESEPSEAEEQDVPPSSLGPATRLRLDKESVLAEALEEDDYELSLKRKKFDKAVMLRAAKRARRESSPAPRLRDFCPPPPEIQDRPVVVANPWEAVSKVRPTEFQITLPQGQVMKFFVDSRAAHLKRGEIVEVDCAKILKRQELYICPPKVRDQESYMDVNTSTVHPLGFLDLPAELRNRIYRVLFVKGIVDFESRENLCRSSALLSTCKKVYLEGCSVLYGENEFSFGRVRAGRGKYFERVWDEIAYEDMYRFLRDIGSHNLGYIPSIKIAMHDGVLVDNRERDLEQRRFVRDQYLRESLKLIARHHNLKVLKIGMHGARTITQKNDDGFLKLLKKIRGLERLEFFLSYGQMRIKEPEMTKCLEIMVKPEYHQEHSKYGGGFHDVLGRKLPPPPQRQ